MHGLAWSCLPGAVVYGGIVWDFLIRKRWPWDVLGRRRDKSIVLKRGKRPWEK